MRDPAANPELWREVQRLVYPDCAPCSHPPFERQEVSSHRKIASWLYYKLLDDAELREKVLG